MIDEKKLIKKIWNIFSETYNNAFKFDEDESKLVERVMCDVQNAIEEQTKIGGWIPCSERLPEESLCSVIGWDEYRKRCCFVQYLGGRWIFGNDTELVKITHWKPVPTAPYEVKSDE